jgi:hypothetical protein
VETNEAAEAVAHLHSQVRCRLAVVAHTCPSSATRGNRPCPTDFQESTQPSSWLPSPLMLLPPYAVPPLCCSPSLCCSPPYAAPPLCCSPTFNAGWLCGHGSRLEHRPPRRDPPPAVVCSHHGGAWGRDSQRRQSPEHSGGGGCVARSARGRWAPVGPAHFPCHGLRLCVASVCGGAFACSFSFMRCA